ncbi:hybrid sensor histidine kinase/response regulator [Undibacterium sp. JH2W]|uniref:ATP-binding response regulator n=1 Tax=Undibacterium sp. JH2W TaxID=3413037 RepID=UPI003BEFFC83
MGKKLSASLRKDLWEILFPDKAYLERKRENHRLMLAMLHAACALFGCLMWFWDYFIDPIGAQNTLGLRLMHVVLFLNVINALWRTRLWLAQLTVLTTGLFIEWLFMEILNRLHGAMEYGIGGFMFFLLMPLVLFQGMALSFGIVYAVCATFMPHLFAWLGLLHDFPHVQYAILLWPACGLFIFTSCAAELNYLRRYHSENQHRRRNKEVLQQKELLEQQRSALEQSNQALTLAYQLQEQQQSELTRFLAVASHDLRQPMHALNLYLGALSNIDLPTQARSLLNNVRHCTDIMDDMFLSLLDVSRLDAHIVTPTIQSFPIAAVLSKIIIEFTPQAQNKHLEFYVHTSTIWVKTDASLLEQMLRNLTANAIRYTHAGAVKIICQAEADKLCIHVTDTGIGISAYQQKTVFEEFFQVGNQHKDNSKGLGLGLAIVKRLSSLLDIPVSLQSKLNEGSCFSIKVPMAAAEEIPAQENLDPSQLSDELRDSLIVVIDDEKSILLATQALLELWGCQVIAAASGPEALSALSSLNKRPDALICDYRLSSKENGCDAIAAIREEFNDDIPALLVTGETSAEQIGTPQSQDFQILHKPMQAEALKAALLELLRHNPGLPALVYASDFD